MLEIKEFNGLNVLANKNLELILAIQAVFLKQNPSFSEEFNYIEVPPIQYIEELETIIDSVEHNEIINDLIEFRDESECIEIALAFNDNYELDCDNVKLEQIKKYLGKVNLESFIKKFKSYAEKIRWNDFYISHQQFYMQLYSDFCDFPDNLDLNDINRYYGKNELKYNYIPSVLMNGGFGIKGIGNNLYYIRGIQWWKEENKFYYDKEYLLECLFHEFSHPQVNPLVDNYYNLFTNIDELFADSLNNNLPKTYQNKKTLLYEYFVRTNAHILNLKYYPESKISDYILQHGFNKLDILIEYVNKNIFKYKNYEDFFKNDLIYFMNNILNINNKCIK